MSSEFSKHQEDIIHELKNGAIIHVYRTGSELHAFLAGNEGTYHTINLRTDTVLALYRKNKIKRKKKEYLDDWAGIWILKQ